MPLIDKPQNINKIWSSSGDRATPSDQKINQGWVPEIPPHQWFNYIDNKQDQAIAHINQMGIPQWDAVTEYQANKSYVQGPTNGVVYRAIQTHTNQNPEVSNGFWEVAFAVDFATPAQARELTANDVAITPATLGDSMNAHVLGMGQTWQDVTASRFPGVTYTNTTGRSILVQVRSEYRPMVVSQFQLYVSDSLIDMALAAGTEEGSAAGTVISVGALVPPGETYYIASFDTVIAGWMELR